jgi:hypothetical protein
VQQVAHQGQLFHKTLQVWLTGPRQPQQHQQTVSQPVLQASAVDLTDEDHNQQLPATQQQKKAAPIDQQADCINEARKKKKMQ